MAVLLRRREVGAVTVILSLVLPSLACTSAREARLHAFAEASAELRRRRTGQSHDDVRKELDLFLENEVAVVKEKAKRKEEHDRSLYRLIGIGGVGLTTTALSSGTLSDGSKQGLKIGLGLAGATAAVGGLVAYYTKTGRMRACQEFLDSSEEALRAWAKKRLTGSTEEVPREVWEEFVERVTAVRNNEDCLGVR